MTMLWKKIELAQRKIAKAIHRTPTGLSQTGRVFRFEVLLRDVPGTLAKLTAPVALKHANILHIIHKRAARDIPVGFSKLILVLETRNPAHIREIRRGLREQGYSIRTLS